MKNTSHLNETYDMIISDIFNASKSTPGMSGEISNEGERKARGYVLKGIRNITKQLDQIIYGLLECMPH